MYKSNIKNHMTELVLHFYRTQASSRY
jgi:hypothetical protein